MPQSKTLLRKSEFQGVWTEGRRRVQCWRCWDTPECLQRDLNYSRMLCGCTLDQIKNWCHVFVEVSTESERAKVRIMGRFWCLNSSTSFWKVLPLSLLKHLPSVHLLCSFLMCLQPCIQHFTTDVYIPNMRCLFCLVVANLPNRFNMTIGPSFNQLSIFPEPPCLAPDSLKAHQVPSKRQHYKRLESNLNFC